MTTEQARPYGEGVYDHATGAWSWNDDMYAVVGLARDACDPAPRVFERMHPDDLARVRASLATAIAAGGPMSGQYRVRDDSGRERVISFVGDGECDEDGKPVRLRAFAFDVTDPVRRVANDAVQAATADRAAIEQVKGALMFAYGVDDSAAFGILTRYSQRANVKVAVLARGGVAGLRRPDARGDAGPSMLQVLDAASSDDEAAHTPPTQGATWAPRSPT